MFGLCFDLTRKVRGQTFRKRLGVDYKTAVQHTQKSPHAIPLNQKQQLLTSKPGGNWKAIRELLRDSPRPFGRFQGRQFIFDETKVPVMDIPDLEGFELKPYVAFQAPKIDKKTIPRPDMQLNKKDN